MSEPRQPKERNSLGWWRTWVLAVVAVLAPKTAERLLHRWGYS